tara:strand:+ start:1017 stop:1394 length:378 start_codon:yes stop_codon:yes gene_type:complete
MSTLSETIKDFNIDELVAVYYLSKSKDRNNAEVSSLSDEQKKAVIAVLPEMHSMEVILALETRKREIELAKVDAGTQEAAQQELEEEKEEESQEQEEVVHEKEPEETETAAQSEEKKSVSTVSDE